MRLDGDDRKGALNLVKHGCDFADAAEIFLGHHLEIRDERRDHGEPRFIVMGYIKNRIMVACTLAGAPRRYG